MVWLRQYKDSNVVHLDRYCNKCLFVFLPGKRNTEDNAIIKEKLTPAQRHFIAREKKKQHQFNLHEFAGELDQYVDNLADNLEYWKVKNGSSAHKPDDFTYKRTFTCKCFFVIQETFI